MTRSGVIESCGPRATLSRANVQIYAGWMRQGISILAVASLVLFAPILHADGNRGARSNFDFVFFFSECKIARTALALSDEKTDAIELTKTETHLTACERTGRKKVRCMTKFDEAGAKPAIYDAEITLDSTTLMQIVTPNRADIFTVDPSKGAVVALSRVMSPTSIGAKICRGLYMTGDEVESMQKQRAKAGASD